MLKNTLFHRCLFLCALLFLPITAKGANYCKMADRIVRSYIKEYAIPRGLYAEGYGGSFMYDVRLISLDFVSNQALSITEARILYMEMMEEFLRRINANAKIRPYLHNYPFNPENFELNISFIKNQESITQDNKVELMYFIEKRGKLFYKAYNSETQQFYDLHTESYEEALEIVKNQAPSTYLEIDKPQCKTKRRSTKRAN